SGKTTLVNHILSNGKGIRFAVIVNDIGEVNIDASLIEKGGIVNQKSDSLVPLQNGCICCTLQTDLIDQITDLVNAGKFDYIVIEASGICEPEPIARTICSIPLLGAQYADGPQCRLDCIITIVDALRLRDEFGGGSDLTRGDIDEEDIENLVIQQIEFCNIVLLNKASEVSAEELGRIKTVVSKLQPEAKIIECDYADVPLETLLDTKMFEYGRVAASAGWLKGVESVPTEEEEARARGEVEDDGVDEEDEDGEVVGHHHHGHEEEDEHEHHHGEHHHHGDEEDDDEEEDDEEDEHGHHHEGHHHEGHEHHHHHHGEGETEEYGIGTFVYYRRAPLDINKFDYFVDKKWPSSVIRAKGLCYFADETDMSYLFEQAGRQKLIRQAGKWYATAPKEDLIKLMEDDPGFARDWDEKYGDRMQKIVFIGRNMDRAKITADLDDCLTVMFEGLAD
ncbi:MAG: GTP-binding protein, partial [Bacteroidales bacterium]|nr:GTP-binding protein [Bacteroidales bacterium]